MDLQPIFAAFAKGVKYVQAHWQDPASYKRVGRDPYPAIEKASAEVVRNALVNADSLVNAQLHAHLIEDGILEGVLTGWIARPGDQHLRNPIGTVVADISGHQPIMIRIEDEVRTTSGPVTLQKPQRRRSVVACDSYFVWEKITREDRYDHSYLPLGNAPAVIRMIAGYSDAVLGVSEGLAIAPTLTLASALGASIWMQQVGREESSPTEAWFSGNSWYWVVANDSGLRDRLVQRFFM